MENLWKYEAIRAAHFVRAREVQPNPGRRQTPEKSKQPILYNRKTLHKPSFEAGPLFAPRSGKCRAEFHFRAVLHAQERQTDSDANYTEVPIAFHQSFDAGDWL